jgi:sigma-B regulation protein RsbU (phosphoserine phosphatase)
MSAAPMQQRKSTVRFRERAELLDFLLNVADVTSETLDLDRLLSSVAKIIIEVIPSDLFAILLYSEKSQGLRIRYSIGHRDELVRNMLIRPGEGIVGTAAATRTPILVDDVRSDERYMNALDAVRSELAVPMIARGKLVGVIDTQCTKVKAYTEHDRALLRLLASRVAVSIDNARLYRRVERQNRTLRVLAHLSQEFSSILALDELLGKIAKTIHALINYDSFSIMLLDAERKMLRHRFSERFDRRVDLDNIPLGKGITGAAAESREPIRVNDALADPRYIASHPEIRSEVAVPLVVQDRVVGVLDLESERMGYFTDEHVRMLTLLAPQIASSVENARLYEELNQREQRMEQDLKAARKLQSVLQPRKAPEIPGLDIAIRGRAAREITGDVYDFFEQSNGSSLLAFGDVSGKGAAAALYGALVSGLLRILAPRRRGPAELLKSLNEALLERKVDAQYATLMVLLWEPSGGKLTIGNAGAEPPLICRDGEISKPHVEGVPIGLLDDREYDEIVYETRKGDVLLFYSDGVEDQLNANGEDFGRSRLARALKRHCGLPPQALVDEIFTELDAYMEDTPITDDQTVIAVRVD